MCLSITLIFCIIGCNSSNSNSSNSNYSTNSNALEIGLVEGKLYDESINSSKDIIYAYIKGSNIAGGWLEDNQNKKIINSELRYEHSINQYETIIEKPEGSFIIGTYTLIFKYNNEEYNFSKFLYKWNTLQNFTSPEIIYNTSDKSISVKIKNLWSYNYRYKLRIYNKFTNTLYFESFETRFKEITERTYLNYIQVILIGDLYENQKLSARIVYKFLPSNL